MNKTKKISKSRFRGYILAGIAALAAAGAIASNLNALIDLWGKTIQKIAVSKVGQNNSVNPVLKSDSIDNIHAQDFSEYIFKIYPDEEYTHSLFVTVTASFRDQQFNDWSYLAGIADVEITDYSEKHKKFRAILSYRHNHYGLSERARARFRKLPRLSLQEPETATIHWIMYLKFKQRPKPSDTFEFQAGPRRWRIRIGNLDWKKLTTDTSDAQNNWWGAHATLRLKLEDPDWVILRSARLLDIRGKGDDGEERSLLEVVIENRSKSAVPVQELLLNAVYQKDYFCKVAPGYKAPPPQSIVLNWAKIVSQPNSSVDDAWATIGGEEISVKTVFQIASCLNDHLFFASVPFQMDVPSGQLRRLTIRLVELPHELPVDPLNSSFGNPPASLKNWDGLFVSLKPKTYLYPSKTAVYNIK